MADASTAEIEANLFKLAEQADAGEIDRNEIDRSTILGADEHPKTEEADQTKAGKSETPDATQPDGADKKTTQEPSPQKSEVGSEKSEGDKADSEYVKATKEAERYDRNWKKFQDEKAAFEAERAELQRLRAENSKLQTPNSKLQTQELPKDERGYTASDYEAAAKDFAAEGETQLAEAARQKAEALKKIEQKTAAERQQAEFTQTWAKHCDELCKAKPELLNFETPLAKTVKELLANEPILSRIPDGFAKAVELAELRLTAGSVPELKSQIEQLRKDLEAANARLSIGGGNPGKPILQRSFSELPSDEQEVELRRMANDYDSAAA